jgi:crossover junction endodeoxyribonuclease RuvC
MGIDPGLRILGIGVVEYDGNKFVPVYSGVVKTKNTDTLADKLFNLYTGISAAISTYEPEIMSIEEAFYGKNANTALLMGHVRGVAMIAGKHAGLRVAEYAARKVKSSVTGNGGADKQQVLFMVKRLLKLKDDPVTLDASDALAIAICHGLNHKLATLGN